MARKHIYIAYTGGTIGMLKSDHGYVPIAGFMEKQLAGMPEFQRPEMPEFTIHEYDPLIDSSDMTPEDWQQIASRIFDFDTAREVDAFLQARFSDLLPDMALGV